MSLVTSSHATTRQFAAFWLGELLLGIDLHRVQEINRVGQITLVPDAPPAVRGVINLRGEVVTVMDLRTILGLPPAEVNGLSRLIIANSQEEQIGLLVDQVADVLTVSSDDESSLPANVNGVSSHCFKGVYSLGNDLLVVLDIETALSETNEAKS